MDNLSYFISLMPKRLADIFISLSDDVKSRLTEIRIRRKKPLIIYLNNDCYFISGINNSIISRYTQGSFVVDSEDFDLLISRLCDNSVHTNMDSMVKGYITVNMGSRCGIAAKAVYDDNGRIKLVRDINSINIRIARQIKGISLDALNLISANDFKSIIVAGKAMSGKTTFIRDMAFSLSSGFNGSYLKTVIIDDRGELSDGFQCGINTDVLYGFSKSDGIETAIRTLSPQVIVCDEIVSERELESISFGFKSGAAFIVSIHLNSPDDIDKSAVLNGLLRSGEFDCLLYLDMENGCIYARDLRMNLIENTRNYNDYAVLPYDRGIHIR